MRLAAVFAAHELRTQARSLRFRTLAGLYLLAGSAPAALIWARREVFTFTVGGATYASETMNALPLLTTVLALMLSLDGITRERSDGSWTTVSLSGISNAGYLLRRCLAIQALLLPLTALPVAVAAGFATAHGIEEIRLSAFALPWLFHIAPLALAVSALGLALGTIAGGAPAALPLFLLVLWLLPRLANGALHPFGIRLNNPLEWTDTGLAVQLVMRITSALTQKDQWWYSFPIPASESGPDLRLVAEQSLATGAGLLTLAAGALGVAVVYLRRTRPDVRPRSLRPDHPLRNFLRAWQTLQQGYTPDPAPAPADRFALAAGLLAATLLLSWTVARALHYGALAAARIESEQGSPMVTPPGLEPVRWRIEGALGEDGSLASRVAAEVRNTGAEPHRTMSFELNPELRIEEAVADRGRVTLWRSWNRLAVKFEPPIPPGGRREIRFRLGGRPAQTVWPIPPGLNFGHAMRQHDGARFSRDRLAFSTSYLLPSVSGYRVGLAASDLAPVPRYASWGQDGEGNPRDETVHPPADVELSLAAPEGLLLADTCGSFLWPGAANGNPKENRLSSRCRTPVSEIGVVGGRYRLLRASAEGGATVAVLPAHRAAGELHLGFLARSAALLEEAWPGLGGIGGMDSTVVLEWPYPWAHRRDASINILRGDWWDPARSFVRVQGNLIFLDEIRIISSRALPPEEVAAEIVAARLVGRRRISAEHNLFFRRFLKTLALERLGLGAPGAAIGPLAPHHEAEALRSAFEAQGWSGYWSFRFPALVSALETRMGEEALRQSVEELLARRGDRAATAEELFEILVRRSPRPVERLLQDGFREGTIARLALEGVQFQRAAGGWRASGRIVNTGEAEATCKVALATDVSSEEAEVRIAAGGNAAFELATRHRPQAVFLDPDRECHRLNAPGLPRDRVYFEGERR